MSNSLDNYLGIHAKALLLHEQRTTLLAQNLTNANTPNYKAQDIDFNKTLKQAMSSSSPTLSTSSPKHLGGGANIISTQLKYRIPDHPSLDGNTVDKEQETIQFTRNALSYQASLTFLDAKIKSMMSALRGE